MKGFLGIARACEGLKGILAHQQTILCQIVRFLCKCRIALEEATSEEASVSQGVLEDRLTETLRQVEAKVDSALALVSRSFPGFGSRNREVCIAL